MYSSNTLNNCHSIDEVVELVNADGCCDGIEGIEFNGNEIAGQYAFQAVHDFSSEVNSEDLEGQLDCLKDAGAKFDWKIALEYAEKFKEAYLADK